MLVLTNTSSTPYVIVIFFLMENKYFKTWCVAINVTNRWGIHTEGTGRWQAQHTVAYGVNVGLGV